MSVQILGTAMYFPGRYPPLPIVLDSDDLGSGWFIHFCWQWAIIQSSIAKGQICIFPFGHSSQAESPDSFPFAGVPTEYAWCWGSSFWKHLLSSAVHQRLMLKGRKVSPCCYRKTGRPSGCTEQRWPHGAAMSVCSRSSHSYVAVNVFEFLSQCKAEHQVPNETKWL